MSKDFTLEHKDEYPHTPDPSASNFNESVYVNGFDPKGGLGGWMRLGNRVNEGHTEMQVCLYVPGNRVVCQFQRPRIDSNNRFGAGGLNYDIIEPFKSVKMEYEGELQVLDDPSLLRDAKKLFGSAPRAKGGVAHSWWPPQRDDVEPYFRRVLLACNVRSISSPPTRHCRRTKPANSASSRASWTMKILALR